MVYGRACLLFLFPRAALRSFCLLYTPDDFSPHLAIFGCVGLHLPQRSQ